MHVLFGLPAWVSRESGVGSVVWYLSHQVSTAGHQVTFLLNGPENRLVRTAWWGFDAYRLNLRVPMVEGHPVRSTVAFGLFLPGTVSSLLWLIRALKIDVVNVHYPLDSDIHVAICKRVLGRRPALVTSIHGSDVLPLPGQTWRRRWALEGVLRTSDRVVAPSSAYLGACTKHLLSLSRRGVVIHNGICVADLADAGGSAGSAVPFLLTIAAHNEKKGLETLLQAFSRLAAEVPQLRLCLAGDGPLRKRLESLAERLGIRNRVDFLGVQSRDTVSRLLNRCLAFVLPSRSEPFGIAILEAMACRKAVVATAVGGIVEIVDDGSTALLTRPDDPTALAEALRRVIHDQDLRRRLGDAGFARVHERFSDSAMGRAYLDLFTTLTESSGAAR